MLVLFGFSSKLEMWERFRLVLIKTAPKIISECERDKISRWAREKYEYENNSKGTKIYSGLVTSCG